MSGSRSVGSARNSDTRSATFVVGLRGSIVDVDENACDLVRYSRAELLQLHGTELIPPDDRPAVAVSLDRMRDGSVASRRGRMVRKDGSVVAVEVTAHRLSHDRLALSIRERPIDG